MKATELMIGDWVMVNDIEHTHPLQVAEIFKKCGAYYATLYWDGMPDNVNPETLTADVGKVLPIPLTPEILEKNGFTDGKYRHFCGNVWKLDIDGFREIGFTDGAYNGRLWGEKIKPQYPSSVGDKFIIPNIKYVHELQHALRLCGINKEIEL